MKTAMAWRNRLLRSDTEQETLCGIGSYKQKKSLCMRKGGYQILTVVLSVSWVCE